jgi:LacI family transcriptional regulator
MPFIDRLRPPLTTVRFPHYQLGTEAAQLLIERINGREGPVKILYLAPELVVRGSTAEPPSPQAGTGGADAPVPLRPAPQGRGSTRRARGASPA